MFTKVYLLENSKKIERKICKVVLNNKETD